MLLFLDPARGGPIQGFRGPGGAQEAQVNLELALALRGLLEPFQALQVRLTREGDQHVSHTMRSRLAAQGDATLALQYLGYPRGGPEERLEVRADKTKLQSWGLGERVARALGGAGFELVTRDGLQVVHNTKHHLFLAHDKPLVRVFVGHLGIASTEAAVLSGEWPQRIAGALARAVIGHFKL